MEQVDSVLGTANARQLWDTRTELNEMQIKSIELGTSHELQLIQGPPGTAVFVKILMSVISLISRKYYSIVYIKVLTGP